MIPAQATEGNARRVLFVDDEVAVLESIARQLRRSFKITVAASGSEALGAIADQGAFPVVVSDFMMPAMNGVELLDRILKRDQSVLGIMLTGNADLSVAAEAVNRGLLFRFLTKPCSSEQLVRALEDAFEQNRLRSAERELLEGTLRGSIEVLAEVLALVNPAAFGTALRVRSYVRQLAAKLRLADAWQHETAALLSQLGCVSLPQEILERAAAGTPLSQAERELYLRHPAVAKRLLEHIPRLGGVADLIAATGPGHDANAEQAGGSRLLKLALEFDAHMQSGSSRPQAVAALRQREREFGRELLQALECVELPGQRSDVRNVTVRELRVGMILDADALLKSGVKVLSKGHELTAGVLERLRSYVELKQLSGTLRVRVHSVECADRSPA